MKLTNKKIIKTLPLLLSAAIVTACGSSISISNGSEKVVTTENTSVTNTTLQELYDDLYETSGTTTAMNEIIYQLGLKVFKASGRAQSEWEERVDAEFNSFFSSSYTLDNEFHEDLLVASLKAKGYSITCPASTFQGTAEDFPEYNNLRSALKCDYSDYIERVVNRTVAKEFLNEEYILDQKSVYFENKLIRQVQYFVFKPLTYAAADKYSDLFENAVQGIGSGDFKQLVLGTGGLDEQWRAQKLDDEAKDFALIDYTKSTAYASLYKNIFDTSSYTSTVQASITSEVTEYSSSGTQSIFRGYELAQKALQNAFYYYDKVGTNEGSTLIYSDLDEKIFKANGSVALDANGYLLVQSGSDAICHLSSDGNYYIVKVNVIKSDSSLADKRLGAKALANNTSNTKNAIPYYLEKYGVTVHEEDLYNYIDETYDYEAK